MSTEGLKSLEEIWASMDDGDGLSDEPAEVLDVDEVEEATEEAPDVPQVDSAGEQSDDDTDIPAKLSDLYAQSEEDGQDDDEVPVNLDQEFEFDDGTKVTLRQLFDERLMRKDYTQKTTEVAETKRELEQLKADLDAAAQLKDSLLNDPVGTITEMALQLGIIDEDTAAYASRRGFKGNAESLLPKGKGPEAPKPEDIEALIEQKAQAKLEELLNTNPAFKQIEQAQARDQIHSIFNQIEKDHGVELDADDRRVILQASLDMNEDNLEYTYLKLDSELKKAQAAKGRARTGQANRSVRGAQPNDADVVTTPPETFEEAWRRTALKLGV